jgi:hypothetical protein
MTPTDTSMTEDASECALGNNESRLIYVQATDPAILKRLDRLIELLTQIHDAVRK